MQTKRQQNFWVVFCVWFDRGMHVKLELTCTDGRIFSSWIEGIQILKEAGCVVSRQDSGSAKMYVTSVSVVLCPQTQIDCPVWSKRGIFHVQYFTPVNCSCDWKSPEVVHNEVKIKPSTLASGFVWRDRKIVAFLLTSGSFKAPFPRQNTGICVCTTRQNWLKKEIRIQRGPLYAVQMRSAVATLNLILGFVVADAHVCGVGLALPPGAQPANPASARGVLVRGTALLLDSPAETTPHHLRRPLLLRPTKVWTTQKMTGESG